MALWQMVSKVDFAVYPAIASNRLLYAGRVCHPFPVA